MNPIELKEIGEDIEKPMGDGDIRKYLPNIKIITNKQLNKYNNIEDIFNKKKNIDSIIILFLDGHNTGHWVALSRYGNVIEFFDSYGNSPQKVYNFVPKQIRQKLGTGHNKLCELLNNTEKQVIYNPVKYQEDNKDFVAINTCGRHCCFRILKLKKGLSLPQYYELMKKAKEETKLPYDAIVAKLIDE
jgi:hypothetical protein